MVSLRQKIIEGTAAVGLGLGSLVSQGCTPQGNVFMRNLAATGVQTAVVQGVKGRVNPDAYPTTIIVDSNPQAPQNTDSQDKGFDMVEYNINGQHGVRLGKIVRYSDDGLSILSVGPYTNGQIIKIPYENIIKVTDVDN